MSGRHRRALVTGRTTRPRYRPIETVRLGPLDEHDRRAGAAGAGVSSTDSNRPEHQNDCDDYQGRRADDEGADDCGRAEATDEGQDWSRAARRARRRAEPEHADAPS
jgi:hypothetical protein